MERFKEKLKIFYQDTIKYPLYLLTHPIKGYYEFKREKQAKNYVAWVFLALMCVLAMVQYLSNGIIINRNDPNRFNAYLLIFIVAAPVFLITAGNWSATALMDGKGTMGDIFKLVCYALFPMIVVGFPLVIISNYITLEEVNFLNIMTTLSVVLTGYMMFFGLMGVHEYSVSKTIITILFTILAIAIIIFIVLLFLTLIQLFVSFIIAIYKEIVFRFF